MITNKEVIKKTKQFVKDKLYGEGTGHDWWHTLRVWQMAKNIGKKEKVNLFVVELASLLHDIADWKFQNGGDDSVGAMITKEWLESLNVDRKIIDQVCQIIVGVSFKGAGVKDKLKTIEGKVVQDADRLDAMGAVGIARCFAYGGSQLREIYNPDKKPKLHQSFEEYKKDKGSSINHFYEKLLLLKQRMSTKAGQQIAEKRHQFMERYLDEFFKEWQGKA